MTVKDRCCSLHLEVCPSVPSLSTFYSSKHQPNHHFLCDAFSDSSRHAQFSFLGVHLALDPSYPYAVSLLICLALFFRNCGLLGIRVNRLTQFHPELNNKKQRIHGKEGKVRSVIMRKSLEIRIQIAYLAKGDSYKVIIGVIELV